MQQRKRTFLFVALALVFALALSACGGGSKEQPPAATGGGEQQPSGPTGDEQPTQDSGPKRGGILKVAYAEEPRTFDPLADPGAEGSWVRHQVHEGLMDLDENGEVVPALAQSYDNPDPLTFVFHLRQGVKFHDGADLNADAVVFNFQRAMSKDLGAVQQSMYNEYIAEVAAVDPSTVRVTLKKPWPDFFIILATKGYTDIHSPAAVEQWGKDYGTKALVGTGPFKFKDWVKGDVIRLERNDSYWREGIPYLDGIEYRLIPEESTRLLAFKTGQVDVMFNVPFKDAAGLQQDAKYTVGSHGAGAAQELWLNTAAPPFNNPLVRQAIDAAIDKEAIARDIFYGFAEPARSIFPKWHWAHWAEGKLPYNPDQAKQLLQQAGYSDSNPLKFTIITVPIAPYNDQAVVIQSQLSAIGVKADIQTMDKSALSQKTQKLDYEAAMYRLVWDPPTLDYSWRPYGAESALNRMAYNKAGGAQNPEVEAKLKEAVTLTDRDRASQLFHEVDAGLAADVPKVKVAFVDNVVAMQSHVKGFHTWVTNVIPFYATWLDQ